MTVSNKFVFSLLSEIFRCLIKTLRLVMLVICTLGKNKLFAHTFYYSIKHMKHMFFLLSYIVTVWLRLD